MRHPQRAAPWDGSGGTGSMKGVLKTLIFGAFSGNLEKKIMDFWK